MQIKKRKKATRTRGSHTHGRGFKKKARGKGHQGGKGHAGSGKRSDQKKNLTLTKKGQKTYFGKSKTLRKKPTTKLQVINLRQIAESTNFRGKEQINLNGYKILSQGSIDKKIEIKASAASKSAIDKVKKAGGNIIIE
jgi:large subunit ribosomal protein L15